MKKILLLFFLSIYSFSLYGQDTVRVAAYNVKQFPAYAENSLKIVLDQIKPTIIMATELDGAAPVQRFLNNVLSSKYKASTEVNITWGYGNECAVFYIDSLLTYLGSSMISAIPRPFAEFKFRHKVTNDTLIIFGTHLKAYPQETTSRLNAVNILRNRTLQFKEKTNYMVVGDFNIFTSTEPAFQRLLDQSTPGYFYDPQNAVGNWTENPSFAYTHTYSPSNLKSRLDMILISQALKDKGGVDYIDNSYRIFGNDGNHYAKSVTNGSNSWFTNISIGNALISASDHLPVFADFLFGVPTSVSDKENLPAVFELLQNYPNPFNPSTMISYRLSKSTDVSLKIYDLLGREVAVLVNEFQPAGIHNSQFSILNLHTGQAGGRQGPQLSSGVYFYQLRAGNFIQSKKMMLIK